MALTDGKFVVVDGPVINGKQRTKDGPALSEFTLLQAQVAALSGGTTDLTGIQSQITAISANDIVLAAEISSVQTQVNTLSAGFSTLYQGHFSCTTVDKIYTISHPTLDPNTNIPIVSLEIPNNAATLFVQGVTNRTANSFDVVLSETPAVTGYSLLWHLSVSSYTSHAVVQDFYTPITISSDYIFDGIRL